MKTPQLRRVTGFSLIEIMVGVVIGLIAILVVYQVFAAAEGIKRNTTSVGDAQQNGLLSSFILGIELANAGNGVAAAARDLGVCPGSAVGDPSVAFASTWRPIPLMIVDRGDPTLPDTFMVNYSVTSSVIIPAPFAATAASSADYTVQSPTGFQANDLIVAVGGSPASTGCSASKVTAVTAPDVNGVVTVSHGPATAAATFGSGASLFDMGPATGIQKVRYDVTDAPGFVLRSTSLLKADATPNDDTSPAPNPLASNIVNMKLLYGIDPLGNGAIVWKNGSDAGWTPADLLVNLSAQTLITQLKQLKAVRIGLIVRGEQWDRDAPDYTWTMFDNTDHPYTGTLARTGGGNYRYRKYETVIPIRNELWNPL